MVKALDEKGPIAEKYVSLKIVVPTRSGEAHDSLTEKGRIPQGYWQIKTVTS